MHPLVPCPAVLLSAVWVIISGFMANLTLTTYIEQGPEDFANLLQLIPAFGLFRGVPLTAPSCSKSHQGAA
jgi:hypothetical protein